MYRLADYRAMIRDEVRTAAYARAIERAVTPGATVVELGTGFGYFAVLACRAGAGRVYAIEPDPVVLLGAELARANDCEGRIEFIQKLSTRVSLEPADVLVSDLRGILPLLGQHIPAIADARRRLLKPGGAQIPQRDVIQLALVGTPEAEAASGEPPTERLDLGPVERAFANLWSPRRLEPSDLMSAPAAWQSIDYRTVTDPDLDGTVELVAERDGCVHGIGAWFETELYQGIGFSTAPGGAPTVYAHALFPAPRPVALRGGDALRVRLRAHLVGTEYVWSWEADGAFAQSTFHATPLAPARLRRRADRFVPRLGRSGQAQAWILARMSESEPLGDIARGAVAAFPDLFADLQDALRCVADLSEQLSE